MFREFCSRLRWAARGAVAGWVLNQDVTICALTRLPKREFFRVVFRRKREFAVILFDLDGFKVLNDRLGHHIGDCILELFGNLVNQSIQRATDFAFRWGGDEFAVFLRAAEFDWASLWAEQVRQNFLAALRAEDLIQRLSQRTIGTVDQVRYVLSSLDLSFGVEIWEYDKAFDAILTNADARMYEQKHRHKIERI